MATERRQSWTTTRYTGATPRITVTLELETADSETGEIFDREPWRAVYELASGGGRAVISRVHLEPTDSTRPTLPLPAQLARELIKPGLALESGRYLLREMIEDPEHSSTEQRIDAERLARWHGLDAAQLGIERRGKRQPDYFYAAIAALYVDARATGSRRPASDVADQLPRAYKSQFVRDALNKARKRGLLERSAGQRRAGGELTSRGLTVLQEGPTEDYAGPLPPSRMRPRGATGTNPGTSGP
jgi:hypothetical protein